MRSNKNTPVSLSRASSGGGNKAKNLILAAMLSIGLGTGALNPASAVDFTNGGGAIAIAY